MIITGTEYLTTISLPTSIAPSGDFMVPIFSMLLLSSVSTILLSGSTTTTISWLPASTMYSRVIGSDRSDSDCPIGMIAFTICL